MRKGNFVLAVFFFAWLWSFNISLHFHTLNWFSFSLFLNISHCLLFYIDSWYCLTSYHLSLFHLLSSYFVLDVIVSCFCLLFEPLSPIIVDCHSSIRFSPLVIHSYWLLFLVFATVFSNCTLLLCFTITLIFSSFLLSWFHLVCTSCYLLIPCIFSSTIGGSYPHFS